MGMILLVLMFFSLFFVQSVANYLADEALHKRILDDGVIGNTGYTIEDYMVSFGSVADGMLVMFMSLVRQESCLAVFLVCERSTF